MTSASNRLYRRVKIGAVSLLCFVAALEISLQLREGRYVSRVARSVAGGAGTRLQKVSALRDYLHRAVTFHGAAHDHRPFLRATAAETLRSGKGYCGEVTRAFICMAGALGIPAQRINLYGPQPHVVAEAELDGGRRVLVDLQNPPHIRDLRPLDQVMATADYDDYSTLNLRRLRLSGLISRVKLEMGPLTFWSENPHALKAAAALGLAVGILALGLLRRLAGLLLRKFGWVRVSHAELPSAPVEQRSA